MIIIITNLRDWAVEKRMAAKEERAETTTAYLHHTQNTARPPSRRRGLRRWHACYCFQDHATACGSWSASQLRLAQRHTAQTLKLPLQQRVPHKR
jgi:hypothetical protein